MEVLSDVNIVKLKIEYLKMVFDEKVVLDGISFDVYDGEFLSILGPSGCGKTTILRLLIGLLQPITGKIYKDNMEITHLHPSKRGMGIVFQNYALFENMNVRQNIEYALTIRESKDVDSAKKVDELLEVMSLKEHATKKVYELSGGQQQRVAIARTLAVNPDVILFDEPMSALDVDTRLTLRQELKELQQRYGSTMIYITHDQEEAFAMSDRIMVMNEGRLHQIDTPENILQTPADSYVSRFVGDNLRIKLDSLLKHTRGFYDEKV